MTLISPAVGRVTSSFGPRKTNVPGATTNHKGTDIGPPKPGQRGVLVHAPAYGTVIEVGDVGDGVEEYRGKYVKLRRTTGDVFVLQHLDSVKVRKGQAVRIGHVLGVMGDTAAPGGVHLHLEVHVKGIPVDPEAYFKRAGVKLAAHPKAGRYTVTIPADCELIVRGGPTSGSKVLHRRPRGFAVTILSQVPGGFGVTTAGRYYPLALLIPRKA